MAVASLTRAFTTCSATSVPLFLAPAFVRPVITTTAPSSSRLYGSTTGGEEKTKPKPNLALHLRPKVDKNKQRGVSAIRRTGPRSMRGRWRYALPVPVARDHRTTAPEYEGTADHGLWGFFDDSRQPMLPPEQEGSHGRSWTYKELSVKSFDDLHKLYWVCVREQNRVLTREKERQRTRAGYGSKETEIKVIVIRRTMRLIQNVLVNRQLSYDQAQILIRQKEIADILVEPKSAFEEDSFDSEPERKPESVPIEDENTSQQTKPTSA